MEKEDLNKLDLVEIYDTVRSFFRTSFKLISLFVLLFTTISVVEFYVSSNYYLTEFVVMDGSDVEGLMVKDIVNHAKENYINGDNLALSDQELEKLTKDISNLKEAYVDTAITDGLHFKLKIFDNSGDLESLQKSMILLISSNKTIQSLNQKRKKSIEDKLTLVRKEINLIDSLQLLVLKGAPNITLNSTDFTTNLYDLKRYEDELQQESEGIGNYQTLRKIFKPDSPERSIFSAILFGVILGFFLGVIAGVIRHLGKLSRQKRSAN